MIFPFHRLFPEPAIFGGLFICLWLRQAISYKVKNSLCCLLWIGAAVRQLPESEDRHRLFRNAYFMIVFEPGSLTARFTIRFA